MSNWTDRLSLKAIRRIVVAVFGVTVILLGIVLSVPLIPGPGFVVILAGLAILATEFVWAKHLLDKARERVRSAVASVTSANKAGVDPATTTSPDRTRTTENPVGP
jgi:uncharacterized protein (TIGR02611 family)